MNKITVSMAKARLAALAGDGSASTADAATSYYGPSPEGAECAAWSGVGAPNVWRADRAAIEAIAALTGDAAKENDEVAVAEHVERVERFHAERIARLRVELEEWATRAADAGAEYVAADTAFAAATACFPPATRAVIAARWAVKRNSYRETMGWTMKGPDLPAGREQDASIIEEIENGAAHLARRITFAVWSDAATQVANIRGLIDEYETR